MDLFSVHFRIPLLTTLWAIACVASATVACAKDIHVGEGEDFPSIPEAMAAASSGDRIVVHSGNYDGSFVWNKYVDIVEAGGAEATFSLSSPPVGGAIAVEIVLGEAGTVTWEGIDVHYEGAQYTRLFLKRGGSAFSEVVFEDFHVTDKQDSGSPGLRLRFFSTETGAMRFEDVEFDLQSQVPEAYEMVLGAMDVQCSISAADCEVNAPAAALVVCEGANTDVLFDDCDFNQTGDGRFVTDLLEGRLARFERCHFAGRTASRGLLCRGFGSLTVSCFDCTWDTDTVWHPITLEKSLHLNLVNCCVPHNPASAPFSILNRQCMSDDQCHLNPSSTITLVHSTFSSTSESSKNTGIRSEAPWGRMTQIDVRHCIFDLPASKVGAVEDGSNGTGGTMTVTAGVNLRWLDGAVAHGDLLAGVPGSTLIDSNPRLEPDLCHIGLNSGAHDQATDTDVVVATDIDGEDRPQDFDPDLGADELLEPQGLGFKRADSDVDGSVDITDALVCLEFLFLGTWSPPCMDSMDTNDDGQPDISDPLSTLTYLFIGGFDIPLPGPHVCGPDPTADPLDPDGDIGCEESPAFRNCSLPQ